MPPRKKVLPKPRGTGAGSTGLNRRAVGAEETGGTLAVPQFPVVAIGASAGGLAAFTALLRALPPRTGMAFVLIQHLAPKHESALTTLLSKVTVMPVVEVSDGIAVEPNHVYVIPPNKYMTIRKGALRLVPRSGIAGLQRPIDEFAIALAEEQGNAAIGVVLSGTGSDGTYGLKAIKTAGGVTFAEDPKSAQWPAMPVSAITAGSVDFVLSPRRIALELARIGRHPYLVEATGVPEGGDLDKICVTLRAATGVDFRLYKQATVRRRIARRMALQKVASLKKYAQILKQTPGEAQSLADDIFIHVTSFFRDPECFEALRKRCLAKLCRKRPAGEASSGAPLRIWVAGCSTGEEVYSIAMLALEELGDRASRTSIQIFGTDIQERSVEKARAGIYTEAAVAGVSPARLKRFFIKDDTGYQVQKFVRELCVFAKHDLAKDPPFSRIDLVSCRNVLIYMGAALQKRVLSTFQYALKPGGFLFLGSSESIGDYSDVFTADDRTHRIFLRKISSASFSDFKVNRGPLPTPDAVTPRTSAPGVPLNFRKEAETILLEHYTPPALVVDPDLHIVHFQGDTSPFLAPAPGQPSFHLLKMVRPELVVDLRAAIQKARRDNVTVHKDAVRFEDKGRQVSVRLEVRPLKRPDGRKKDLLVVFRKIEETEPAGRGQGRTGGSPAKVGKHADAKTDRLEKELISTRENLISLISEHETAQEEMKAANEEILSSNEELQSTNEELETAKEELQSTNEELITLNEELQNRNAELNVLNQDLSNLLLGIDISVLVLDAGLRVRRFTPVAGALLNLIPGDVGRPFSDIASNLDVADWKKLFARVTDQGQLVEREVSDRGGHRYSLRMRPYKTTANEIGGVLVVLFDIEIIRRSLDEARQARDVAVTAEERADSILNSLTAHVSVLGPDGVIAATNQAWDRFARENGALPLRAAAVGANYPDVCRRAEADGVAEARPVLNGIEAVLRGRQSSFQLEYSCHSAAGQRWFLLNVTPLKGGKGGVVVAHADITERKEAQIQLEKSTATVRALLESNTQAIIAIDSGRKIVFTNGHTEKMFGYGRAELLGQSTEILLPSGAQGSHAAQHEAFFADMQGRPMGIGTELEGIRKNGIAFPVEIGLSYIETHDEGTLGVAFISDITERKRLETALRQREQEVTTVLDDTPDLIMRMNREFHLTYVNAKTAEVTGLPAEVFIGKTFLELPLPRHLMELWRSAVGGVVETGLLATIEFPYPSPGGVTEWEERLIPEFAPDGSVESVLIIGHDVTEKKRLEKIANAGREQIRALAASLLTAQEEERRRVSRELHDQICQELASLAFEIGGLAAKPPRRAEARDRFKALQARVVKASEETRHIAYELHPSVLDDLGLESSLRELCKRFSEGAGRPKLEFKSAALPGSLPREVASCLYRVAQESLRNIVQHSGAKRASIEITLNNRAIAMTIADDGAGFDPEAARGQGGLGLIGMEERTRLCQGTISIESQPRHGTRIAVQLPLPESDL